MLIRFRKTEERNSDDKRWIRVLSDIDILFGYSLLLLLCVNDMFYHRKNFGKQVIQNIKTLFMIEIF